MSNHSSRWSLDPEMTFINHGSFGACPVDVLDAQQRYRAQMESEPVRFFMRELPGMLDKARAVLAKFVGASSDDLAWVPNATIGVNTVLRSLEFGPSDELLYVDHAYNACKNAVDFIAQRRGATAVMAVVPFPLTSPDQVVEAVLAKVSPRTRLAMLDHITSPTGLVLPIQRLVDALQSRGIDCLVDGAHAPGQVPLDLQSMGAAYYTGNCHKWLCAPKGAAFLYVRKDRQAQIHPLQTSHGYNMCLGDTTRFRLEFDWQGTDDPSAFLCVAHAIEVMGSMLDGGWKAVMRSNHDLALAAQTILCEALQVAPPCPKEMVGSMAAVTLRGSSPQFSEALGIHPLSDALFHRFGIEVPVSAWPTQEHQLLRVSAQLYNNPQQYEYLAASLRTLIAE